MATYSETVVKPTANRRIAVIGLGYAGLPLAVSFSKHNSVVGFDIDNTRIAELKGGHDRHGDHAGSEIKASTMMLSSNADDISDCDFYIIVVPTPVNSSKEPDLQYVLSATKIVGSRLKKGDIVVYESTVYPGATEEICVPILESESQLSSPKDFAVGYSPERISGGDPAFRLNNTVKIVAGQDAKTQQTIKEIYSKVVEAGIWEATSIRVAEAAKLVENTQRDVNIALMNEFALLFDALGINTREVLQAARTKHNFAPFLPGLVGGHCISVDPYYVMHKAERVGRSANLIECSRRINESMPKFIVERTLEKLSANATLNTNPRVGVLGITFKENFADIRESKSSNLVHELRRIGLDPLVHDPLAKPEQARALYDIDLKDWSDLTDLSAVIVAVAHDYFRMLTPARFREILKPGAIIIDVKQMYDCDQFKDSQFELWQL